MIVYTLAMVSAALEVAMNVKGAKVLVTSSGENIPLTDDSKSERWGRVAIALTSLAFALHFAGVIARGISAHRVPWGNMYEFSTTGSVAVTGMFLLLLRRHSLRWLTLVVTFSVLMTLGTAITLLYRPSAPLVPALTSMREREAR